MLIHLSDLPSTEIAAFSPAAQIQKWISDKAAELRTQSIKTDHLSTKHPCDLAPHWI